MDILEDIFILIGQETESGGKSDVLTSQRAQMYSHNKSLSWLECYWIFMEDSEIALPLEERPL